MSKVRAPVLDLDELKQIEQPVPTEEDLDLLEIEWDDFFSTLEVPVADSMDDWRPFDRPLNRGEALLLCKDWDLGGLGWSEGNGLASYMGWFGIGPGKPMNIAQQIAEKPCPMEGYVKDKTGQWVEKEKAA